MEKKQTKGHPILACVLLVLMLLFLGLVGANALKKWIEHGVVACFSPELTETEAHTQRSMEQAVQTLEESFADFQDCILYDLWYEEDWAAPLEQSRADSYGEGRENWLFLLADMQTGRYSAPEGYWSNTRYEDYCFLLHREGGNWKLVENWPRTEPERPSPTVVTPTPEPTKSPDD